MRNAASELQTICCAAYVDRVWLLSAD